MEYISLEHVLMRILRDDLFNGISIDFAIDHTIDFFEIVDVPAMFIEKMVKGTIVNHKAILPPDVHQIIQIVMDGVPLTSNNDTFGNFYDEIKTVANNERSNRVALAEPRDNSFRIKGNTLFTARTSGDFMMVYSALPVDENSGFPLIPEDRVFISALQKYLEMQFLKMLWRNNKVTQQVYEGSRQDYYWAVGQYETHSRRMNLSQAESFFNMYNTLRPRRNEFLNRFRNLGAKEYLLKQR